MCASVTVRVRARASHRHERGGARSRWTVIAYVLVLCVQIVMLRNHGVLVCAETIEEAWYLLTNLITACETQVPFAFAPAPATAL